MTKSKRISDIESGKFLYLSLALDSNKYYNYRYVYGKDTLDFINCIYDKIIAKWLVIQMLTLVDLKNFCNYIDAMIKNNQKINVNVIGVLKRIIRYYGFLVESKDDVSILNLKLKNIINKIENDQKKDINDNLILMSYLKNVKYFIKNYHNLIYVVLLIIKDKIFYK